MEGMKEEENAEERMREKREHVMFEKISEGTCVCVCACKDAAAVEVPGPGGRQRAAASG